MATLWIVTRESGGQRRTKWFATSGGAQREATRRSFAWDGYEIAADVMLVTVTGPEWAVAEILARMDPPPHRALPTPVKAPAPNPVPPMPKVEDTNWRAQVKEGLLNLGWKARDAREAVECVAKDVEAGTLEPTNTAELLKRALRSMSKVRRVA